MLRRFRLIAAFAVLLPSLAYAISVPAPEGMCALDANVPEQASIITCLPTANIGYTTQIIQANP